jgi:hypothetical protein
MVRATKVGGCAAIRLMAVNKPTGDKARKGAVKKRTQLNNPLIQTSTKRNVSAQLEARNFRRRYPWRAGLSLQDGQYTDGVGDDLAEQGAHGGAFVARCRSSAT